MSDIICGMRVVRFTASLVVFADNGFSSSEFVVYQIYTVGNVLMFDRPYGIILSLVLVRSGLSAYPMFDWL
jgi:hypothetical protein